jgi:hypothetical protein
LPASLSAGLTFRRLALANGRQRACSEPGACVVALDVRLN